MRSEADIRLELARVKAVPQLSYSTANVVINAPLALTQLELEARVDALNWVLADSKEVRITHRGWPGHHIYGARCVFHLNTLLELGDCCVVVSTVGNFRPDPRGKPSEVHEVGYKRHYETQAYVVVFKDGYWDMDWSRQISLSGKWFVYGVSSTSDAEAQVIHETQVENIRDRMLAGEKFTEENKEGDNEALKEVPDA